jgi:uncharacterized membrane protein YeaQ/YmgE (transglycosylase-associated protein family)
MSAHPEQTPSAGAGVDPVAKRLTVLRDLARDKNHGGRARKDVQWSRFWNYSLLGAMIVGGLVATVAGTIAGTDEGGSSAGYVASVAGAVVTAATVAAVKLKPAEKLRFAVDQRAAYERVALLAENALSIAADPGLVVNELTEALTSIYGREPPD